MISKATGTFSVKLELQPASPQADAAVIGRRSLEKSFHGDLEAASSGEMLSVMTAVDGSMAYVALEKVSGTLAGKQGSFLLQHASQMVRGQPFQSIRVVPDSATGDLLGLDGEMRIDVRDGEHFYVFEYSFSEQS
ncbi:DUF3224 domain-containing protein [Arenimonas sp. GDDSR-1]|uniref:DUF3224 domain-containing protein n=1 Tax=Arenimonas sp. GDDSR-1 TaxID=2950125 RepID=UPI00262429B2|nr:DUF3224 domain-containing protein [Arenimonas sp. GDDSR-1]